jgi:hypothetical protein
MEPTQSAERRIAQKMTDLGLTADFLGQLTAMFGYKGLAQPVISKSLRGTKPFTNEQSKFLLELLTKLEDLRAVLAPIVPAYTNPAQVKRWLDDWAAGSLVLIIVDSVGGKDETEGPNQ